MSKKINEREMLKNVITYSNSRAKFVRVNQEPISISEATHKVGIVEYADAFDTIARDSELGRDKYNVAPISDDPFAGVDIVIYGVDDEFINKLKKTLFGNFDDVQDMTKKMGEGNTNGYSFRCKGLKENASKSAMEKKACEIARRNGLSVEKVSCEENVVFLKTSLGKFKMVKEDKSERYVLINVSDNFKLS